MARIKLGSIVTDLSGSAGGGTIQNSLHGHILRNKPTPCNPASAKQLSIRSKIKTLQRAWINLSDAQRKEWNAFPAWANQTTRDNSMVLLSGHELFIKYQMFRLIRNYNLLTTFDYTVSLSADSITSAFFIGGFFYNYFTVQPQAGNFDAIGYFSGFTPTTRVSKPRRFLFCYPDEVHFQYKFSVSVKPTFGIDPFDKAFGYAYFTIFHKLAPLYRVTPVRLHFYK